MNKCIICMVADAAIIIAFLIAGCIQYYLGYTTSGAWMLVVAVFVLFCVDCKRYCFTRNEIEEYDSYKKSKET